MKYIVANWKEHPAVEAEAVALARASDGRGMVICPPHRFLEMLSSGSWLKNAALGAQDYTPDIYALGARYVIVGHSDRRRRGDTDAIIAEKTASAFSDGLTPMVCVGETKEEWERGETENVIAEQVRLGLSAIVPVKYEIQNKKSEIWIAYEPVWAISTEPNAEPETVSSVVGRIAFLKEKLLHLLVGDRSFTIRYFYGGSVNSANAHSFLRHPDIDGLLVGVASLNLKEIQILWQLAQQKENKS